MGHWKIIIFLLNEANCLKSPEVDFTPEVASAFPIEINVYISVTSVTGVLVKVPNDEEQTRCALNATNEEVGHDLVRWCPMQLEEKSKFQKQVHMYVDKQS